MKKITCSIVKILGVIIFILFSYGKGSSENSRWNDLFNNKSDTIFYESINNNPKIPNLKHKVTLKNGLIIDNQDTMKYQIWNMSRADRKNELLKSKVRVVKDTLKFNLFYGKGFCREYEYRFTKSNDSLIIKHVDNGDCLRTSAPFGLCGKIFGIKPGKYILALKIYFGNNYDVEKFEIAKKRR